jgi:osmotically-inducible protein OsmY
MKSLIPLSVLATALLLLAGCAEERQCGFRGCSADAAITANVQALIKQHSDLGPPDSIYVQTLNHVVYLSGQVSDGIMKQTAEALAKTSPGVTRVVNTISVEH